MVDRISAAGFIGRERELAELEASLADARDGRPQLVFVAGESGVGKSRLLGEFERRAKALGARTIGGECIELGEDELPFAPLVGAVRPLARADDPAFDQLPAFARSELARLAPELGPAAADRSEDREGESQQRLFDALLSLLERLGDDTGLLFWIEDIHWADRSTRTFLAFLNANIRDERVLVVATYRSDELHRRHPLRPLLNEFERGTCSHRLELPPFDRHELTAQLADILGSTPSEEVVDRLFARSEGNPLFTEELLAGGLDGRGALPPTLREALLTRLDQLSPAARQTLGLLAVAGRADDATLIAAGSLEAAELREALREAMGSHLVRTDDADRLTFRHALFREVVYEDLLPGERSELHLSLARVLEERAGSDDGTWLRTAIAHHYHQAGDQREALRTAVIAADRSERVYAPGEAAQLFDRALGLWPRVDDPESVVGCRVTDVSSRAARAHYLAGDDPRAKTLLEQALDELDPEREPLVVARLLGDLANVQWSLGHAEHSRASLDRALELVGDEPTPEGARLLSQQVKFKLLQGRFGEMEPIADRALEMADALDLPLVRAGVLNRFGPALFPLGDPERGEQMMREGLELAKARGAPDDVAIGYVNYADVLHVFGRSEDALELLDEGVPQIATIDRSARWLLLLRAEVLFAVGDWGEAAAALLPARGVNSNLRHAEQAMGRGDLEEARSLLTENWEMLTYSVEPQFIAVSAALLAELQVREREIDAGRTTISDGLDRIQYCTEDAARIALIAAAGVMVEAAAAESARDLGNGDAESEAIGRAQMLLELTRASAEEYNGPVEKAVLATATAQAARASAGADAAELWTAAAETWRELGRPYEEARSLWRRAEALIAADDRVAAGEAATTATTIARRLGANWLVRELESLAARARLVLDGAAAEDGAGEEVAHEQPEDPFGLTDRERQVLALVASGATNREIASELFMAEKTASVHVSRILGKLGVRSRTEAAAVAYRQGLAEAPNP
jgi:DNA-binding CsgD family transcriptional regulator